VANPSALLLAACLMLDHLEEAEAARRIRAALKATLATPEHRTGDLGGSANTREFTDALLRNLD
jgi:isocitrate dehydrogenase (NAD+)